MSVNVNVGTVVLSNDAAEAGVLYILANATPVSLLFTNMTSAGTTGVTMVTTNASAISVNQAVAIANEIFTVTGKSVDTLTVTRAAIGTTAAAHTAGDQIRLCKQASLPALCKAILQKAFADALAAQGSTGVATQQAVIATAQAAIQAIQDAAVS